MCQVHCKDGYQTSGTTDYTCSAAGAWDPDPDTSCTDIDECAEAVNPCQNGAACSESKSDGNIAIGDFVGVAKGVYDIDRLGIRAEVKYGIETEALRIAPLISIDYTTLMQSEITETGGGAADLTLPSRDETARTLRVGFDLTTTLHKQGYWTALLENADGVWRPNFSLRWRQPLGQSQPGVNARFSAAPGELFSVQGDDSGEGFELGIGVDWTPLVANRLTFTLRYDGFLWDDVTSNAVTGRVRLSF